VGRGRLVEGWAGEGATHLNGGLGEIASVNLGRTGDGVGREVVGMETGVTGRIKSRGMNSEAVGMGVRSISDIPTTLLSSKLGSVTVDGVIRLVESSVRSVGVVSIFLFFWVFVIVGRIFFRFFREFYQGLRQFSFIF